MEKRVPIQPTTVKVLINLLFTFGFTSYSYVTSSGPQFPSLTALQPLIFCMPSVSNLAQFLCPSLLGTQHDQRQYCPMLRLYMTLQKVRNHIHHSKRSSSPTFQERSHVLANVLTKWLAEKIKIMNTWNVKNSCLLNSKVEDDFFLQKLSPSVWDSHFWDTIVLWFEYRFRRRKFLILVHNGDYSGTCMHCVKKKISPLSSLFF